MKYNFRLFIFLVTALISTKVSASQSGGGNNQAIPLPQVSAQIQAAHNFANFCASCHRDDLSWFAKRKWKYGKGIGDGSVPEDNPFVNQPGANKAIWSYGHRNPQGLFYNLETGVFWEHEHGPKGGDELNIIQPGKNYGWPVITYGINYDGTIITKDTAKVGMDQPITYWVPSIAPCGITFVKGGKYIGWEGNILMGSLRFRYLVRCELKDKTVVHKEILLPNIGRLRNVIEGPDGYIYIAVENPGMIFRLVPVP